MDLTHRLPMAAEEFLADIIVTDASKNIILGVRAGVAYAIGTDPTVLYPSDSFTNLLQLTFDGMDFIEVLVGIERVMHVRIRDDAVATELRRLGDKWMDMTLIEFAQLCVRSWRLFADE